MKKNKICLVLFSISVLLAIVVSCQSNNETPEDLIPPEDSLPLEDVATVYQNCDYSGYSVSLCVGTYNLEQFKKKGIRNNDISSFQVSSGYIIEFFDGDNLEGQSLRKIGSTSCLENEGWNDKTTSLRIVENDNTNPPSAPSALIASALSDTRIKLTWKDNSDDEINFNISVFDTDMVEIFVFTANENETSKEIEGLTIDTEYSFQITAESFGGISSATNIVTERTKSEPTENIDDLMQFAGGYTESSVTPMGKHFENLHVATANDIAYLNDANNQPPNPKGLESRVMTEFTVKLYPYGTPSPADVNQHAIGDCNGLTAMASMAYLAPNFVKNLITDNGNGTFTIKMFDPLGKQITVKVDSKFLANSSGDLEACSGKNGVATWSTVLEKAIMKYNVIYQANSDIGGIGSEHVTPLFTGEGSSYSFNRGILNASQLARVVKYCLANGKFISGGFSPQKEIGNVHTVTAHGYALVISSNPSALFGMRNPWGVNPLNTGGHDASKDGVLEIPTSGEVIPTIDLRIINPGIAGDAGRTDAYIPPSAALKSKGEIRISPSLLYK